MRLDWRRVRGYPRSSRNAALYYGAVVQFDGQVPPATRRSERGQPVYGSSRIAIIGAQQDGILPVLGSDQSAALCGFQHMSAPGMFRGLGANRPMGWPGFAVSWPGTDMAARRRR